MNVFATAEIAIVTEDIASSHDLGLLLAHGGIDHGECGHQ